MSREPSKLEEFTVIDSDFFSNLLRDMGKGPAACYQIKNTELIQIMGAESESWPASASIKDYYTSYAHSLPVGWTDMTGKFSAAANWPKKTRFYFPEQTFSTVKLVFVAMGVGKRASPDGSFDGLFEALSHRISAQLNGNEIRVFLDRVHLQEKMSVLSRNLTHLLNHELRTPLSLIRGYAALLHESLDSGTRTDFASVIEVEIARALTALERWAQVIDSASGSGEIPGALELIDIEDVCQNSVREHLSEHSRNLAEDNPHAAKISIYNSNPGKINVRGDRAKLTMAFGEVIKNALRFTRKGQIEVYISNSDGMVAVDIMDDGEGIAPGVEDLIFLNFFQDRSLQQGAGTMRKGFGMGLFLARSIIEEHAGQLGFMRAKGRIGFFRFLIPADFEEVSGT